MNAHARRMLTVRPRPFPAVAHWCASGAHYVTINLGGPSDLLVTAGEVDRLIAALSAFKTEMAFEDGRPIDRVNDAHKALGVF